MRRLYAWTLMVALIMGAGLVISACGEDMTCAEGTLKEGSKCVPLCTEGQYFNGTECVDIPECAAGTTFNAATNTCEPDIVDCEEGTTFNAQTGKCEVDSTACAPGTHLVGSECMPDAVCGRDAHIECTAAGDTYNTTTMLCEPSGNPPDCVADYLPDPDVPDNESGLPEFTLPAAGESISLGGTVAEPIDLNGDGYADADWDYFVFRTTQGGIYLRIWGTSEDACLPAFIISGIEADSFGMDPNLWEIFYERYSVNPNGLDSQREVYLPKGGVYLIQVTDYNNMVDALFGGSGIPVGGDDFTYYMTIENLGTPQPTDVATLPSVQIGNFDEGKLFFYSLPSLTDGDIVTGVSAGLPVPDVVSDAFPALMLFAPDGSLQTESAAYNPAQDADVLFVAAGGEYLLVQDFLLFIGPNREFYLTIDAPTPLDCATEDCGSRDLAEGASDLLVFDLSQNEIFFHSAMVGDDVSELLVRVYDLDANLLSEMSSYYDWWYDIVWPTAYLTHQLENPSVIITIKELYGQAVSYTQEIQFIAESLLAEGDNTDLAVVDFPEYTYWDAGIDQFDGQAGQLVVFTDYLFTDQPNQEIKLIMEVNQETIGAIDASGYPIDPPMALLAHTGRYIHWVFDYDPYAYASFKDSLYSLTMSLLDVAASAGTPADGAPIDTTSNALDADTAMTALLFTGLESEGFGIVATPPGGRLETQVEVYARTSYDELGYLVYDPDGNGLMQLYVSAPAAAGDPVDTGFFTSPYDGDLLVVIRDISGTADGTEVYDLTISKAVCPPGLSRCSQSGNVESCEDGTGWAETEVCSGACDVIGDLAACVKLISSLPYTDTAAKPPAYMLNYYRMTLASDATVDIEVTMPDCSSDDPRVHVYDAAGDEIAYDDDGGQGTWCSLIQGLPIAGGQTYFIGVYVYSGTVSTDYTLSVTAQ